jgi:HEAT repeat protein
MGFFDSLFGPPKTATPSAIATQVKALQQRHGDPSFRYQAADVLAGWATPEAIFALLERFTVTVASETSDEAEKNYVGELITDKIGKAAVEPIEKFLNTHENVAWPLRLLEKLVTPEECRERTLRVLGKLDTHFDRLPERKVEMLHFLVSQAEHAEVADAAHRFLEDTDDRVRIAAIELLKHAGRPEDVAAMAECFATSPDRPRVLAALAEALAGKAGLFAGRAEEIQKLVPAGYSLSPEGTLAKNAPVKRA